MDKIHEHSRKTESYGISSANDNSSPNTEVSLSPPPLQFKSSVVEEEHEESTTDSESTYQLVAGVGADDDKPADTNPSNTNNSGLPTQLKAGVEQLSGYSLDDVKVHYNSSKPAQLKAYAYAQGSDIHLGPGQEKHLPHEAWHVVQQKQGRVNATTQLKEIGINDDSALEKEADEMGDKALQLRSSSTDISYKPSFSINKNIVQAKFVNSKVGMKRTTLRSYVAGDNENFNVGANTQGESISRSTKLLVNDTGNGRRIPGDNTNTRYRQAINVDISNDNLDNIPDNKIGWIKAEKVTLDVNPNLETIMINKIKTILGNVPGYGDLLSTEETATKIMLGAVRYKDSGNGWKGLTGKAFTRALQLTVNSVFPKLQAGAIFTGDMLDHWKNELGPDVEITNCSLTESDLHEHGLGVVFTKFRKTGPNVSPKWANFAGGAEELEVVLKPEDKSLEKALIGSQAGSAANQINNLLGLDEEESLATIKMETTPDHGSMIEKVQGANMKEVAKNIAIGQGQNPDQGDNTLKGLLDGTDFQIAPAFHETMTFAFIAGIGDLHWENVMYTGDAKPVMIDADNVVEHDQMEKQNYGASVQSGFGTFNNTEATENTDAMSNMDGGFDKSKIFTAMFHNPAVRDQISAILKAALAGKTARVVPVGTGKWAVDVNNYKGMDEANRTALINSRAREQYIVQGTGNDGSVGAGLIGNCYVAQAGGQYDEDTEKEQLRIDFDGGIIPFYNYDFDSGNVTHNGPENVIYKGQTATEAIDNMVQKFIEAQLYDAFANMFEQ